MRWHWSYRSLPELAGLPADERRRVWERAGRHLVRRPAVWAAVAGQSLAVIAGSWQVGPMVRAGLPAWLAVASIGAIGGLTSLGLIQVVLHAARPCLLREPPGRCGGCGYDLTGNDRGTRPECGTATAKGDT